MIVATPYNDNVIVIYYRCIVALYYNDEYVHYTAVLKRVQRKEEVGFVGNVYSGALHHIHYTIMDMHLLLCSHYREKGKELG